MYTSWKILSILYFALCLLTPYFFPGYQTKCQRCSGVWIPNQNDRSYAKLFWKNQWRKYKKQLCFDLWTIGWLVSWYSSGNCWRTSTNLVAHHYFIANNSNVNCDFFWWCAFYIKQMRKKDVLNYICASIIISVRDDVKLGTRDFICVFDVLQRFWTSATLRRQTLES